MRDALLSTEVQVLVQANELHHSFVQSQSESKFEYEVLLSLIDFWHLKIVTKACDANSNEQIQDGNLWVSVTPAQKRAILPFILRVLRVSLIMCQNRKASCPM